MRRRLNRSGVTRAILATGLVAYLAPLAVPIAARVGHQAFHASQELRRYAGTARLLGTLEAAGVPDDRRVIQMHSHGDGTPAHTHTEIVDLLLTTSDSSAADLLAPAPQPDRLSQHIPPSTTLPSVGRSIAAVGPDTPRLRFDSYDPVPLRPPPRA